MRRCFRRDLETDEGPWTVWRPTADHASALRQLRVFER